MLGFTELCALLTLTDANIEKHHYIFNASGASIKGKGKGYTAISASEGS